MAEIPVSLFFKGVQSYGIGILKFDLLLSEDHNFDNTITEHPVEDGSIISDHIQNELENGSLTGLISNFSVNAERSNDENVIALHSTEIADQYQQEFERVYQKAQRVQ